jgi:protein arginine N-methyltransferase 1
MLVLDEHRHYLADEVRVSAFEEAIHDIVNTDDVVLDLGCGTGILGLLACRAGARRVYSIEAGSIIGLAREVARANGFDGRMTFIRELSTSAQLPERADVLVTDQIGGLGFEAGLIDVVADAERRLLKPDYRSVPCAVTLIAAPVEAPAQWRDVRFWSGPVAGLTFEPFARAAASTGYRVMLDSGQLLAAPAPLGTVSVRDSNTRFSARVDTTVQRSGTLHGIACWFEARLSPGVTMTNSPVASRRINRRQVFLPAARAIDVECGDTVALALTSLPAPHIVQWRVSVHRADASRPIDTFSGSTFDGMLVSAEDLARTDPRFVPCLTAAGRGRRTVLELCDGRSDLASIEREVFARHPELFATSADAAVFVAEVVSSDTRTA